MRKLAVVLFLAFSTTASAQYGELWFSAGKSIMQEAKLGTLQAVGGNEDDFELEDGFRFGFRIGFNGDTIFGHEIQYAYSRTQLRQNLLDGTSFQQGMAVHQGGYNYLVYATPLESRIRPFATGGVMFANYVPPGSSATQGGGQTKFGFNYGGGVKARITSVYAIRFDVRQYTTPKPDFNADFALQNGWIKQLEVSAGFGIVF